MAIADGFNSRGGVVNEAGVFRIPVVVSKVYVETEPTPAVEMATKSMFPVVASPVGDAGAMDSGQDPPVFGVQAFGMGGAAGGYLTSVNVPPIWSIMKSEMLSDPWLATNTYVPLLSTTMPEGLFPVSTGEEGGLVPLVEENVATARAPDFEFSTYCETPPGPMPPVESTM
jgi:hypothetical protein